MPVLPLAVVLRPGASDNADDLVTAADALGLPVDRFEIRSNRKGLELRCVYINDANAVIGALNAQLSSKVRIVDRAVRYLTEPELMEPVMRVELEAPAMVIPVVMALFVELRGTVTSTNERDQTVALIAEAPLHEILDLESRLAAVTDNEGRITTVAFSHHAVTSS